MLGILCLTLLHMQVICGQTFWKRDLTPTINFSIAFSTSNSNVGKCSLDCQSISGCGSFSLDTYTSECTGYLTNTGNVITMFSTTRHMYFLPYNAGSNDDTTISTAEASTHVDTTVFTAEATTHVDTTVSTTEGTTVMAAGNWSHLFTTCGAIGINGPLSCDYSSVGGPAVTVSSGVQEWTVPYTGYYRIDLCGAGGGAGAASAFIGGKGARMSGTFYLYKDTLLNIVVGQMGEDAASFSESGGGGGGSFVYSGNIGGTGLLIAAGGGGGGGEESTANGYHGQVGEQSLGGAGYTGSSAAGNGGLGYGGVGGVYTSAGAGWLSDGAAMVSNTASPGTRWLGGPSGNTNTGVGGFGGGGSGVVTNGGGSGGGYTGGAGFTVSTRTLWGGAGGGSFNGGTNQNNTSGFNAGDGYVKIYTLV